ncbi:helix-turn-helix domain-containing protein [Chryseobacterium sp. NRRL B-14859]|uniref:helix-turn-helix domain-containing protein n=1 Tax=Chryseobacterium sp. NRRL B-14859 TaxID=1562763 RepID=UPI0033953365
MKKYNKPDYKRIFTDILIRKYPEKQLLCGSILNKKELSVLDILDLNRIIFNIENIDINQKYRSFNETAILQILDHQKKYKLNNSQLAQHFRLSRNTVTKWKRIYFSCEKKLT